METGTSAFGPGVLWLRSCCLRMAAMAIVVVATAPLGVAQPVRGTYFEGDWHSLVSMRWVSGFAQGFDVLYIATPFGVGRLRYISGRFLPPLTASSGLDDPEILRLAYDEGTGTLWVESPMGFASFNETFGEWRRESTFPEHLVRDDAASVRFDNLFTPWELSYHPPDRGSPYGQFVDRNLRSYPITTALRDITDRNRIYIGTWGRGAGEVDKLSGQVTLYATGPYQSVVQAMRRTRDAWVFAGREQTNEPPVISLFDLRDSTWAYAEPFYQVAVRGDVTCMAGDGDTLFFGTPQGLLRWDRRADRWRQYTVADGLPDDWVTALYPDGDLLWVGTRYGPGLLDPRADTGQAALSLAYGAIGSPWVYAFEKAYGHIWAGTQTGLYRIQQDQAQWSRITTRAGLLRGHVRALAYRPEGIWCATDAGLLLLDSLLEPAEVFRSRVELSDGDLYTLAVDASNLWAGSRSGVWRYIRSKSTWRLYTTRDGLLHPFAYDIRLEGDYVWFATEGGATRFFWNSPTRLD